MVQLILNGVNINCFTSAPLYIANAEKAMIVLADGTENSVTDGTAYVFETVDNDGIAGGDITVNSAEKLT